MHVILEDIKRAYPTGAIVENEKSSTLAAEGVTTLQVEPALFAHSPLAGYVQRFLGFGNDLPNIPAAVCNASLYVVPYLHTIRWVARVQPNSRLRAELSTRGPVGVVRLAADCSQGACECCGIANTDDSVIDLSKLGELRDDGGWIARGSSRVDVISPSLCGFSLYGYGRDLKIVWFALSQTE